MHSVPPLLRVAALAVACSVAACGGGASAPAPAPTPVPPPGSGSYAWVLKAEGPTNALKYGLSLLHRGTPTVEWQIEPPSAVVTDARTVSAGTVDGAGLRSTGLAPYALIYIVGGDVRRVSLRADGRAPLQSVQRAGSASACRFVLEAADQATPESTRFIVATAGADGSCGTADDGRAEVRLDATLGVTYTPITAAPPLAALRDPVTLAPRGWLTATTADFWNDSGSHSVVVRDATRPVQRVVAGSYRTALVESADGLALLDLPGADAVTEVPVVGLDGTGWQTAGHDADAYYVYRNSDASTSAQWRLARISKVTGAAVELDSGTGQVSAMALGTTRLYATVLGAANNQLLQLDAAVPGSATVLETSATNAVSTVLASGAGVHLVWRVSGIGTGTVDRVVRFVDETAATIYSTTLGGFPLALVEQDSVDWRRSENRSRFLFADGYGAAAFSGASLQVFDAATRAVTTLGTLPTASALGADFVFANASGGPGMLGTGFAAKSTDGIVGAPYRVFAFEADRASSLQVTTQTQ